MGRVTSRIRHDYKPGWRRPVSRGRLQRIVFPAVGIAAAIALLFALFDSDSEETDAPDARAEAEAPSATPAASDPAAEQQEAAPLERRALALPPSSSGADDAAADAAAPAPSVQPPKSERVAETEAAGEQAPEKSDPATSHKAADDADVAPSPGTVAVADAPLGESITLKVRKGDSLDSLFRRNKLSVGDLARMLKIKEAKNSLRKIQPGDEIPVLRDGEHVLSLTRKIDEQVTLQILADGDGYRTEFLTNPVERRQTAAQGKIASSLFLAGAEAGLSDTLIMNFAGIFAWDVDFALEVRTADTFSIVYEEIWQDGEKLRDGEILAAEFVNQGEIFRAVRFEDPNGKVGYFTPEGRSVRKAFLRAPLDFRRVSSNFNPNRRHPILKTKRPHQGVDYAAARGTPVKAAGDGKIILRGRKGGYGNTVIIQHGGNITTLYAHLSRFRKGQRNGSRVRQGQVIGYVGATGLATGPHLHYEYRVNGVHRNPRTVSLPAADPVPKAYREQFAEATRPLLETLDAISPTRLAAGNETLARNDRQPGGVNP